MPPTLIYPLVITLASLQLLEILQVCVCLSINSVHEESHSDNHDIISVKVYDIDSEDKSEDKKKEVIHPLLQSVDA